MKKFSVYLLAVFFLLFTGLSGCVSTPEASQNISNSRGIFWKIEKDPNTPPSYLFGTIHSEDPRVISLPEVVEQAFKNSATLALEIELNQQASSYATRTMFYSDGRDLPGVVGDEMFQKSVSAMQKKGIQEEQVRYMKPWAVFTMLNMPDAETGIFLDVMLYQRKVQKGETVVGLETIQEQVATLDEMPLPAQLELLRSTLDNADQLRSVLEETIDIYLSRDLDKIESLNDEFLKDVSPATARVFTERLIEIRNQRMLQRMKPLFTKGNAFVAVGALHLPGEKGLLTLLKQNNFSVTSLY